MSRGATPPPRLLLCRTLPRFISDSLAFFHLPRGDPNIPLFPESKVFFYAAPAFAISAQRLGVGGAGGWGMPELQGDFSGLILQ